MKIVVDTNVIVSGIFFHGAPQRVVEAVIHEQVTASASPEIIGEYERIIHEMLRRGNGKYRGDMLTLLISKIEVVSPSSRVEICRDPDDDKFIECALDSKAIFIVSGDKDLLSVGGYAGVEIITAARFCEEYL